MSDKTKIQWTDVTWNIAIGCTKISKGCKNCYMYRDGKRFNWETDKVKRTKQAFTLPLRLKKPSKIFTCSLTDFFHEDIDSYRDEAWEIIKKCPQHLFQILTKRPERIKECLPEDWGSGYHNVWLGVTVESFEYSKRFQYLKQVPAVRKFVSCEPLLLPIINIHEYDWIDWVIVGCESGPERRKTREEWFRSIKVFCEKANIPLFIKQLEIDGKVTTEIDKFPEDLRIRQFPESILGIGKSWEYYEVGDYNQVCSEDGYGDGDIVETYVREKDGIITFTDLGQTLFRCSLYMSHDDKDYKEKINKIKEIIAKDGLFKLYDDSEIKADVHYLVDLNAVRERFVKLIKEVVEIAEWKND